MKTSKEYRMQALEALRGKYGLAIAIMFVYDLIIAGLTATGIGAIILSGAFMVGLCVCYLNLMRGKTWKMADLFAAFSSDFNFSGTIGLSIRMSLRILLWSLLAIVPGIVASYRYALAPYIMADNPQISGKEAIEASKALMKGKKGKLFCLDLSYIGWILLSILTLGILMLWVQPRMEAAHAAFYEDAKKVGITER